MTDYELPEIPDYLNISPDAFKAANLLARSMGMLDMEASDIRSIKHPDFRRALEEPLRVRQQEYFDDLAAAASSLPYEAVVRAELEVSRKLGAVTLALEQSAEEIEARMTPVYEAAAEIDEAVRETEAPDDEDRVEIETFEEYVSRLGIEQLEGLIYTRAAYYLCRHRGRTVTTGELVDYLYKRVGSALDSEKKSQEPGHDHAEPVAAPGYANTRAA